MVSLCLTHDLSENRYKLFRIMLWRIRPPMHDRPAVESADVLLAALERANDAVVILDQDHRISHFNASAERIWGVGRAGILGRPAAALGLNNLDEDARAELTITRPDGSRLRVALSLSHVTSGGVRRTIALVRDITPDLELRERLALHVMIADGTNRAVIIVEIGRAHV